MIDTSNKKEIIIREDYLESLGYKQVYDYVYIKDVYLKQDPSLEFYLDESSNKVRIRRRQN